VLTNVVGANTHAHANTHAVQSKRQSNSNVDTSNNTTNNGANYSHVPQEDDIIQDEDNYDDLEVEQKNDPKQASCASSSADIGIEKEKDQIAQTIPKWTGPKTTIESIERQEKQLAQTAKKMIQTNNKSGTRNRNDIKLDLANQWSQLDDIPLGRTGAKIMVTFGDNIHTNASSCSKALLYTRQCLQYAIKDARALRRQMKRDYNRAKGIVNLHKAKKKERLHCLKEECDAPRSNNVDPTMLFKAIGGYDKIVYDPKCGFDDTQLEKLFPEEMHAYKRWRSMHKAYTDSKNSDEQNKSVKPKEGERDTTADADADAGGEKGEEDPQEASSKLKENDRNKQSQWGGHLNDRMEQFDARTERMKEEWYMTFSVVRQGSFLSKSYSAEDRQWEKTRKEKNRGKRADKWQKLHEKYVQ